jgi:hypothetical protein|uniref:Uncharacterized protein n=1 Tax=Caudovirales sp. ctTqA28 TaxID=2826775 RepID=A0A8S5MEA2_9CAUD|nr:MAG TPA: hypothetical protein [Caudovirales sp. ctTqA28]
MSDKHSLPQNVKERISDAEYPNPNNPTPLDLPTYAFLDDALRTPSTNYKSEMHEFIRREVIQELRGIIFSCVKLRK